MRVYPQLNARLLAPLSLMLIPVLGFILQPRWFQGVSCCLVNPCPALSCRDLPGQPGCGGTSGRRYLGAPRCRDKIKDICWVLVAGGCSHIVLPASSWCCCILSGVGSEAKIPSESKGFCLKQSNSFWNLIKSLSVLTNIKRLGADRAQQMVQTAACLEWKIFT